jgi:hypothetical protein
VNIAVILLQKANHNTMLLSTIFWIFYALIGLDPDGRNRTQSVSTISEMMEY